MPKFDDYHRTVVGYHGTGLTSAHRIITRIESFNWSQRDYDWLGSGVYFWEYAPKQALGWARLRQRQFARKANKSPDDIRRATEPLAVVACMIRLGHCLDLTEPENINFVRDVFQRYKRNIESAGGTLPSNDRHYRRLDCAVFNYAFAILEKLDKTFVIDTARGIYVPAGGKKRVWDASWISHDTHVQLCVRNPISILGAWLHHPTSLEVNDVREAIQGGTAIVERAHPEGEEGIA